MLTRHISVLTSHTQKLGSNYYGFCTGELGEIFGVNRIDAADVGYGVDDVLSLDKAGFDVSDGPVFDMRGLAKRFFQKVQVLRFGFGRRTEFA